MPEHATTLPELYQELVVQFRPPIDRPLARDAIVNELETDLSYWPHPYALCVDACERRDRMAAEKYLAAFAEATADKDFPEIAHRREELRLYLGMIDAPETLGRLLDGIRCEKLRAIGLAT